MHGARRRSGHGADWHDFSLRGLQQLAGDVWDWTAISYTPHPGQRAWVGAVGAYTGSFLVHRMVLRGRSCATPRSRIHASCCNCFPTDARRQFSGLRLTADR